MKVHPLRVAITLATTMSAAPAWAGAYVFTELHPPRSIWSIATAINDHHQVVGQFYDGMAVHGFVWQSGQYTVVDAPARFIGTVLTAVNNRGTAVGFAMRAGRRGEAVIYRIASGKLELPLASDAALTGSELFGINNHDVAVGFGIPAGSSRDGQALILAGGVGTLVTPSTAAQVSSLIGINDAGVGFGDAGTALRPTLSFFEYDNGQVSQAAPGAVIANIGAVSPAGTLVGTLDTTRAADTAFLYQSGTLRTFRHPGATFTTATTKFGDTVIGTFLGTATGYVHVPYVRIGAAFHDLDPFPGEDSVVTGATPDGSFVGTHERTVFEPHAFVALCATD